ncbi:beta-propeller domain-containing protein [Jeotgalibacillus soli]|uniref:SbsA Ig-like domain-containing protein n=1 Tax=Jeotgalibacillus soli TaxID=889306 RepID=A0A0C2VKR2_9BACL|nr:beta-propeller domain-containing protein [Jeotgalibacillus soli]KIL49487.1 hypothetical protein KP78_09550 [Jeotgalibacillus soli]
MKKKRMFLGSLLLVVIIGAASLWYFSQPTITAGVSDTQEKLVFSDKIWTLQFSSPLEEKTIHEKSVYVTDQDGNRLAVAFSLNHDGTILQIVSPQDGYSTNQDYVLHLSDEIKSTLGFAIRGTQDIPFRVISVLPAVESEDQLTEYFTAVLENDKERQRETTSFSMESSNSVEDSASSGTADQASTTESYSETNNQVDGVNEADMIKTDGTFIYRIIDNQKVEIVQAYPANTMTTASTIQYDDNFYPSHLFLHEETLIVLGDKWIPSSSQHDLTDTESYAIDHSMTVAKIYNIDDKTAPALIREVSAEGHYNSARMIDSYLYFVTDFSPYYWTLEENKQASLRPSYSDSKQGESIKPIDLEHIQIIPETANSGYTTITSVNISDPEADISSKSFLGSSGQLYMSEEHLYLAAANYSHSQERIGILPIPGPRGDESTKLFKFQLDGINVKFIAQGEVKGTILNQFSMDEYNGYFRIVTTEGSTWGDNPTSRNHLFILDEAMAQAGSVEDLAFGERIYSARFMGDKAYMVTFRETDPLFVIDTANPEAPEVLGELKIPGFSNYLHPLDDQHLIGIGMDTELVKSSEAGQPPNVVTTGVKVSLFDITDFTNPKEQDSEIIGGQGTHSPVLYDHKSLFQHREKNLYGFPINVYNESDKNGELAFHYQGGILFNITAENGIELTKELYVDNNSDQLYEDWNTQVQRMLYIEDTLYTLANNGINAYDLTTFEQIN